MEKAELAVEFPGDLIEIGDHDEKCDGPVIIVTEKEEARVGDLFHPFEEGFDLVQFHGLDAREFGPGCIEDLQEIINIFVVALLIVIFKGILRVPFQLRCFFKYYIVKIADKKGKVEGILVEIVLEAITFEQIIIILVVVRHVVDRLIEPVHQAAPEIIAGTEVDRAIHDLHAFILKPVPGSIKKCVGCCADIDAVKESHTPGRLVIFGGCLAVIKSSYPANHFLVIVDQYPPDGLPVAELFILIPVKDLFDILVEGPDPVFIIFI